MRPLTTAVVGALAGAVAATVVVALRSPPPAAPDEATSRSIARMDERLDRLERAAEQRPRAVSTAQPPAPGAATGDDAPEFDGRGFRAAPAPVDVNVDLSKVSSADLSLDADERWARDEDVAGAAKRYRELLSRGGSPSERRHWFIRLGDCFVRMQRHEEGLQAYRDCIDASTEDHVERVACMISLARRALPSDAAEASRWIERALALETGRTNETVHRLAADIARQQRQDDREIRELQWLVDNLPHETGLGPRLAELRGERR